MEQRYTTSSGLATATRYKPNRWALPCLVIMLTTSGVLLWRLRAPVAVPTRLPTLSGLRVGLQARTLDEVLAAVDAASPYLHLMVTALWGWIALSTVLQLAVALLDVATRGASWVRDVRHRFVDPFSSPTARRIVTGAVHTALLVKLTLATPNASAAPAPAPITLHLVTSQPTGATGFAAPANELVVTVNCATPLVEAISYTVQPGDSLWSIAERYYGTGHDWQRLMAANEGRTMPGSIRFSNVLQPGWEIHVPTVNYATTPTVSGALRYTVQSGDTLRGIAATILGDESCWPAIFEANVGVRGQDGRQLDNPDLIWPGMRLTIPQQAVEQPAPAPIPAATPPASVFAPEPTPVPLEPIGAVAGAVASGTLSVPNPIGPPPPTVTPAAPTAVPAPIPAPLPLPLPSPEASASPTVDQPVQWKSWGAPGAGAAGIATTAYLWHRRGTREIARRLRHGSPASAENRDEEIGTFAATEVTAAFAHRLDGEEFDLAVLTATAVVRFLAVEGLHGATLRFIAQDRDRASVVLDAPGAIRERLLALASTLGERLGGRGEAHGASVGEDVTLILRGITRSGLLTTAGATAGAAKPNLLPLGILPPPADRHKESPTTSFSANWDALGPLLVAGAADAGMEVVLMSVLAELGPRQPPAALRLAGIAAPGQLPGELLDWPHWAQGRESVIAPDDRAAVDDLLESLRAELARRIARPGEQEAKIGLVIGDMALLAGNDRALDALDQLARDGAAHGLRLLVGTTAPGALDDDFLARFATRLVLRVTDEDDSTLLLGHPGAARLTRNGQALIGRPGQPSRRLIGYRVTPAELAHLTQLMRDVLHTAPSDPQSDNDEVSEDNADDAELSTEDTVEDTATLQEHADTAADDELAEAQEHQSPPVLEAVSDDAPDATPPSTPPEHREIAADDEGTVTITDPPGDGDGESTEQASTPESVVATNGSSSADPGETALESAEHSPLEVTVFVRGEPRVRYRGQPISLTQQGKSHLEFLALLAAAPGGAVHRDVLEQALWPQLQESGDLYEGRKPNRASAICTRLREAVRRAAPDFPADVAARIVRLDRANIVHLNTDLVRADAIRFQEACDRMRGKAEYAVALAAWREARELFREDLLVNAGYLWADDEARGFRVDLQEWYRTRWSDALHALAGRAEHREHDRPTAIMLYEEAFAAECRREGPVQEEATRGLMRCHAASGHLAAAERAYRALREEHKRKYGASEPLDDPLFDGDPETEGLCEAMRARAGVVSG